MADEFEDFSSFNSSSAVSGGVSVPDAATATTDSRPVMTQEEDFGDFGQFSSVPPAGPPAPTSSTNTTNQTKRVNIVVKDKRGNSLPPLHPPPSAVPVNTATSQPAASLSSSTGLTNQAKRPPAGILLLQMIA